ncbi:MAG: 4-hydroxy-tetrahydrodipicolinate synthase [Clostridia bacterium]|nr:4-hydroxy-tetrahydrodipicolinate synthase [Clostridia bacterium]
MALFNGAGVALVTPFDSNGGVNFSALDALLTHVLDGGVGALFACGTTGEPSTMTKQERESVISYCVQKANGKVPVFAGSGGNNTQEAIAFSRRCEELGVDGLLVVTPYYNKCTQNGAYLHYKAISESVHIPIIAYNVPTRTGFNLAPATVARLCELPNVRGIKEASGDIDQMLEVARLISGKMDFYSGDDSLTVPAMSIGAKGVISVAANVIPSEMQEITELCEQGNYSQAAQLGFRVNPFVKKLFSEVNPIPCKKALQLLGIDAGIPRLPLTEMEPEHTQALRAEMQKLGLIS